MKVNERLTYRKRSLIPLARIATAGASILLLMLASMSAEASEEGGLFIEPSATYETSTSSINYPSPLSDSSGKVEGFGVGARVGLHLQQALFIGIDGRYSMPKFTDSSTNSASNAKAWNWGPVLGLQMPDAGLRLWGGYVAGGELDPESSGSFDAKFANQTGYRLGVGFHVASVSLNLEYQDTKFGTTTVEQFGPFTPGTVFNDVNLKNKSWIASVSMPLEL
ncbi:MAG: outer membrane beta-barrel protein [Bdellovibrionota bacterium]